MSDNTMVVTLLLDDQLTDAINKVKKEIDKTSDSIRSFGREVSQIGKNMAFFGAAITGPFVLAMKKAAETNSDVAKTFKQLQSATDKLNQSIAVSLIPIMQTFVGVIVTFSNWWNSLSQSFRDFIVQTAFLSGAILAIGGIITVIVGKLISLSAVVYSAVQSFRLFALLNGPLLITTAIIGSIIFLMIKFRAVGDTVVSTFEMVFRFLMNGFHSVNAAIGKLVEGTLNGLLFITEGIAKIPGPTQEAFQKMSDSIRQTRDTAREFADLELNEVIVNTKKIGDIFLTGQGEWSNAFQIGIDKIGELSSGFQNLQQVGQNAATTIAVTWTEKWNVIKNVVGQLGSALQAAAAENKKYAVAAQAVAIGMAIMNTAEGITNIWAKWGAFPPVAAALTAILTAATAIQIATISKQSFAVGSPNVPSDMTAQIHKGETIIPATFADAIRKGDLSLGGPGGGGSGDIQINLYGITINSKDSIRELAEDLGFEIDRNLRNARARV